MELGFWIPTLCRIPDSLSCIPNSKAQDSGNHKQIFPDSGIWIPLHGANIACRAEQTWPSNSHPVTFFLFLFIYLFIYLFIFWEKSHRDLEVNISLSLMYLHYFSYLNKWILSYLMPARLLERWFLKFLKSSPACLTKGTWSLSVHISKADKTTRMFILRYIYKWRAVKTKNKNKQKNNKKKL